MKDDTTVVKARRDHGRGVRDKWCIFQNRNSRGSSVTLKRKQNGGK